MGCNSSKSTPTVESSSSPVNEGAAMFMPNNNGTTTMLSEDMDKIQNLANDIRDTAATAHSKFDSALEMANSTFDLANKTVNSVVDTTQTEVSSAVNVATEKVDSMIDTATTKVNSVLDDIGSKFGFNEPSTPETDLLNQPNGEIDIEQTLGDTTNSSSIENLTEFQGLSDKPSTPMPEKQKTSYNSQIERSFSNDENFTNKFFAANCNSPNCPIHGNNVAKSVPLNGNSVLSKLLEDIIMAIPNTTSSSENPQTFNFQTTKYLDANDLMQLMGLTQNSKSHKDDNMQIVSISQQPPNYNSKPHKNPAHRRLYPPDSLLEELEETFKSRRERANGKQPIVRNFRYKIGS